MEYLISLAQSPEAWAALTALLVMEIVLGIDNLLFIAILTNKLPEAQRPSARRIGISLALIMRLVLLSTIAWIAQLTQPLFTAFGHAFSWRDIILIAGGLFLVWKATTEIHHAMVPEHEGGVFDKAEGQIALNFSAAIAQIIMLDLVFSIDSILTAIGMTDHLPIMVIAVVGAVILMLVASAPLANFINQNPTIVMLALGFLLMIGITLIAEGIGYHVPKDIIYAAMAFSAFIEGLNMLSRKAKGKKPAAEQAPSDHTSSNPGG
jgi:predicted tellurium resistance membrane protein TerC